jgi:hypothetical protein
VVVVCSGGGQKLLVQLELGLGSAGHIEISVAGSGLKNLAAFGTSDPILRNGRQRQCMAVSRSNSIYRGVSNQQLSWCKINPSLDMSRLCEGDKSRLIKLPCTIGTKQSLRCKWDCG